MRRSAPLAASLLFAAVLPSVAQVDTSSAGGAGLIYGSNHALLLRAPNEWLLDSKSGRRRGLQAVFYPRGSSWAGSPAVMYCEVVTRDSANRDRASLIDADIARHRSQGPLAVATEMAPVAIDSLRSARIVRFAGDGGPIEQIAYIEERTVVATIVLSCRTDDALVTSQLPFERLIRSYVFLGDDRENILRAIEAVGG